MRAHNGAFDVVRHNHLTKDIKPHGVCPACDHHHERRGDSDRSTDGI